MFIQPDWWEVTNPGVGTNRYRYSRNDPVNFFDKNGNWDRGPRAHAASGHMLTGGFSTVEAAIIGVPIAVAAGVLANNGIIGAPGEEWGGTGLPSSSNQSIDDTGANSGAINVTINEKSGSYVITFPNGKVYVGKGMPGRARQSAKEKIKEHFPELVGEDLEEVTDIDWEEAEDDREAFKQEDDKIQAYGGPKSGDNYNKINSPGKKYNEQDRKKEQNNSDER